MIVGCMIGGDSMKTPQRILREAKIPNFPDLEDAFRAVGNICRYTCRNADGPPGCQKDPRKPAGVGRPANPLTPAILPSYIPAGCTLTYELFDWSLASALLLVLVLLRAGCTQPVSLSPAPPSPPVTVTTAATSTTTALPGFGHPGADGSLPSYWSINVQAQSNGQAINPQIIITFRGGMGMNLIPRIELKVTRSDGVVETGEMDQPFSIGQSVTFAATTGLPGPGRGLGDHAAGRCGQDP